MNLAPGFQFSSCQGNKKALLIGINYRGMKGELKGCVNDVRNLKQFITGRYGFREDAQSMVVLTDDQPDPAFRPTKQNILNAMAWLVGGVQPG